MPTEAAAISVEGDGSTTTALSDNEVQTILASASSEAKCLVVALLAQPGVKDAPNLNNSLSEIVAQSGKPLGYSPSRSYLTETCKQLTRTGMVIKHPGDRREQTVHAYELSPTGNKHLVSFIGNLIKRIVLTYPTSLYELWGTPRIPTPGELAGTVGRLCLMQEVADQPLQLGRGASDRVSANGAPQAARQEWIKDATTHPFMTETEGILQVRPEFVPLINDLSMLLKDARDPDEEFTRGGRSFLEEVLKDPDVVVELLNRTFDHSNKTPDKKAVYGNLTPAIFALLSESEGVIAADQLIDMLPGLFPELSPTQLKRLSSKLLGGKVPGLVVLKDSKHALVLRDSKF